ncbi:UDP-N-acetylmuramate dehydrogenase [Paraglaciecola sp. 2405UD69-4]|uniref:UDP-N-acetylmuramate dehydrogenase n=1 Tax=Paraglaciecola sp. 2405UD69-4 TaxID=3391836 RepID=UPI0039C9C4CA
MHSLTSLHTFGLSSSGNNIISIDSFDTLKKQFTNLPATPFCILGGGSNTVFLDDYQGTVFKIALQGIQIEESDFEYLVTAAAGENWHQLVSSCMQQGIHGLENLALIPGTVGAAPIQNIGAYGVEIESFIRRVDYFDLDSHCIKSLSHDDCLFGYRDSIFKSQLAGQFVITQVVLALPKNWVAVTQYGELRNLTSPTPEDIFNKVVAVRKSKLPDPMQIGNAGSFFKNPIIDKSLFTQLQQEWPEIPSYPVNASKVKVPAAWLIDRLGFKGKKNGGIGCHPNQALVLFNDGAGTGEQLLQFARGIKAAVNKTFSIDLENEVRLMDKQGLVSL